MGKTNLGLFIVLFTLFAPRVRAQQMMPFLFGGPQRNPVSVGLSEEHTADTDQNELSAAVRFYKDEKSSWSFIARGQRLDLDDNYHFEQKNFTVPREFGSADAGLGWAYTESPSARWNASFLAGSAGTRLLQSANKPILSAFVSTARMQPDKNEWIFLLAYSNNRTLWNNIPIPGVAYAFHSENSQLIIGLPFCFWVWTPRPYRLTTVISPFNASVDVNAHLQGLWSLYVAGGWTPKAYQNVSPDDDSRLIYDKSEAGLGVRLSLGPNGSFSLGYKDVFRRRLLLAKSISKASESLELSDVGGFALNGRLSF